MLRVALNNLFDRQYSVAPWIGLIGALGLLTVCAAPLTLLSSGGTAAASSAGTAVAANPGTAASLASTVATGKSPLEHTASAATKKECSFFNVLGSATVSLAIPIYRGLSSLKGRSIPLVASLCTGGLVSIVSAVGIATLLGADTSITGAMYPKSVTASIAMGITERIGVSPTLTAIFAVSTGIFGAILAPFILNALGIKVWWQRGFAIGIGAHGIGTSRAFSIHPEAGTYASLAMGMNGVVSAVAIPIIYHLFNK
uniref:LrgB family protein n=1 Tax=Polynucleobacter necessarius subsp. necessarius (strain STIR1) TaxID=452638 RepID=B1XUE1_POLNS